MDQYDRALFYGGMVIGIIIGLVTALAVSVVLPL